MDALRHLRYVKAAHEGTRRMRDTMTEMGLPEPEFQQAEIGGAIVRVTLRNNIKHRRVWVDADVASLLGAQMAEQLDPDQKRFLNFIAEHGSINISDAGRLSEGRTWHYARKLLLDLVSKGIIDHIHRDDLERDPKAHFVLRKPQR